MNQELLQAYDEYQCDLLSYKSKTLTKLLSLIIQNMSSDDEKETIEEDWLNAADFVSKYRITFAQELHHFYRFNKDFEGCCKQVGRFRLFNVKLVFEYIIKNKKKHPRIYKRLEDRNFYDLIK